MISTRPSVLISSAVSASMAQQVKNPGRIDDQRKTVPMLCQLLDHLWSSPLAVTTPAASIVSPQVRLAPRGRHSVADRSPWVDGPASPGQGDESLVALAQRESSIMPLHCRSPVGYLVHMEHATTAHPLSFARLADDGDRGEPRAQLLERSWAPHSVTRGRCSACPRTGRRRGRRSPPVFRTRPSTTSTDSPRSCTGSRTRPTAIPSLPSGWPCWWSRRVSLPHGPWARAGSRSLGPAALHVSRGRHARGTAFHPESSRSQ